MAKPARQDDGVQAELSRVRGAIATLAEVIEQLVEVTAERPRRRGEGACQVRRLDRDRPRKARLPA
jgi:hypothetical protein